MALFSAAPLFAQFDFPPMGGRSAAMGGTAVALDDAESAMYNIAAMPSVEENTIALAFRQNWFVEGLTYAGAGALMNVPFGTWAASWIRYGDANYNEQQMSLAYAMEVGKGITFGVAFHYLYSSTSDVYYDPLHLVTFSAAVRYVPSERFAVAFKAYNPIAVSMTSDGTTHVPSCFSLGVSYRLMEELLAAVVVEKNLYYDPTLRFGLEYGFLGCLYARAGLCTAPTAFSFGAGIKRSHFAFDVAAQTHSTLGLTPQLSAHYNF